MAEGSDQGGSDKGIGRRSLEWFFSPQGWKGFLGRALLVIIVLSILMSPFSDDEASDSTDTPASEVSEEPTDGQASTSDSEPNPEPEPEANDSTQTDSTPPPNEPPEAAFTVECEGLTCTFDASNSTDPDGEIEDYSWELTAYDFSSGKTTNHTYDEGGKYTVTLTVTDNRSGIASATQEVTVVEPQPDPITFSGSGDDVTSFFTTDFKLLKISLHHEGSQNFAVWLMDEQGDKEELWANKIGNYDATRYFNPDPGERYLLEVTADGPWEVIIDQPRPSSGSAVPTTLSGTGDTASEFLSYDSGLSVFEMSYSGEGNFAVWLYSLDGTKVELLANEIGNYDGSTTARIPADRLYALDIVAGSTDSAGDWTIQTEQ